MEPALILLMMIMGWLLVALSMLWGMMRIARRHHPPQAHPAIKQCLPHQTGAPGTLPSWHA
ncbi:hypothetical protein N5J76_09120 [Pseudomonas sp. GD03855]|nr:hypothetical protein [Pseudomonas sp. GD03909]MDH2247220.1 hypothetical protein [Pseudomonas sp. GD03856]MDH2265084.1 hypothetical protein [Pseudomonas sp. GD03855]OWG39656.1 hypothetical protein CAQ69_04005 [Stutzerimonas stutzeri]